MYRISEDMTCILSFQEWVEFLEMSRRKEQVGWDSTEGPENTVGSFVSVWASGDSGRRADLREGLQ